MAADRTSFELISHFDGPDVDTLGATVAASVLGGTGVSPLPDTWGSSAANAPDCRMRGVRWVLKWAAAAGVLLFSTSVLIEFAYLAFAAHDFSRAARAGAGEATLPRATFQSVQQTVARRLSAYPDLAGHLRVTLLQNGAPALKTLQFHDGDRICVILSADSGAVVPAWIQTIRFWRDAEKLEVSAERQLPGRYLASGGK